MNWKAKQVIGVSLPTCVTKMMLTNGIVNYKSKESIEVQLIYWFLREYFKKF